ncbi:CWF19-like protein 1 isoform X3 [Phycodurus eques]|uniref:CWF19-like protein 1 isoform X3 n=1 Tax=Phycodurus eques TaxID=693459 RepID=UPI002ACE6911|nr:CWF19-like protein 1 isoform X3 [Phycodurus eques]
MEEKPARVLVCGDVEGKLGALFNRVHSIQKKTGQFDLLLCVGEFFASTPEAEEEWQQYKSGAKKAPIHTYILGAGSQETAKKFPSADGCELADNITYLGSQHKVLWKRRRGQAGRQTEAQIPLCRAGGRSLRKVTLQESRGSPGKRSACHSLHCLGNRQQSCQEEVPVRLQHHSHEDDGAVGAGQTAAGRDGEPLQAARQRRGDSEERLGRRRGGGGASAVRLRRHVALTSSRLFSAQEPSPQFFFDLGGGDGHGGGRGRKRPPDGDRSARKRPRERPLPPGECWFCLASPQVEKHLVVSIGTHCYLALAKGGLNAGHVLILPIGHYRSTVELASEVLREMDEYKAALRSFYKSRGERCVLFERNYRSQHLQLQVVPVPPDRCPGAGLKEAFVAQAQEQQMELVEIPQHSDLKQIAPPGVPYFYVELDSGDKLFYRIQRNFPLQFGREVLASEAVLNIPTRADWKECRQSRAEEEAASARLRDAFRPYDFAWDE